MTQVLLTQQEARVVAKHLRRLMGHLGGNLRHLSVFMVDFWSGSDLRNPVGTFQRTKAELVLGLYIFGIIAWPGDTYIEY